MIKPLNFEEIEAIYLDVLLGGWKVFIYENKIYTKSQSGRIYDADTNGPVYNNSLYHTIP